MRNLPLFLQIWLVFAAITIGISLLLASLFPWTLRQFFTKEIYVTIENAQAMTLERYSNEQDRTAFDQSLTLERRQQLQSIRTVNHVMFSEDGQSIFGYGPPLPGEFMRQLRDQALRQDSVKKHYAVRIENRQMFYVITKVHVFGQNAFLISFMWDSYRNDLVRTLFKKLMFVMGLVFLFSWVPALLLAKYLSKPLVILEKHVDKIANRDWYETIFLDRSDEIGRLGQSIETLRKQILKQDEAQQSFIQHVSHELKTPVMVVRSYAQSIRDGIFPKGDLASTVQVIDEEAERLEKRIRNLLYITKLDYMAAHAPKHETVNLEQLIEDLVERLRWRRSELDWSLDLSPASIIGDEDQWRIALEALLDNQIRYAKEIITVKLSSIQSLQESAQNSPSPAALIHLWNDGPPIEPETMKVLFKKFSKGYKGEFGLGLAILNRIATLHKAKVWAVNEENGVSFYVEIPTTIELHIDNNNY
ncbi:MAG: HAMP domain-containing sensor histidine kinase [Bacillota bacterium]